MGENNSLVERERERAGFAIWNGIPDLPLACCIDLGQITSAFPCFPFVGWVSNQS